jgi:hypothetical protein
MIDPSHLEHGLAVTTQQLADAAGGEIGFNRARAAVMATSCTWTCWQMEVGGMSMADTKTNMDMNLRERHDAMSEKLGLNWFVSGMSLGHIVGAGAILGFNL